jgi:hypothetical protein
VGQLRRKCAEARGRIEKRERVRNIVRGDVVELEIVVGVEAQKNLWNLSVRGERGMSAMKDLEKTTSSGQLYLLILLHSRSCPSCPCLSSCSTSRRFACGRPAASPK